MPVDFSAGSIAALRRARQIAEKDGALLMVIHVIEPHHADWKMDTGTLQAAARNAAHAAMKSLVSGELDSYPHRDAEIIEGHAAHAVCNYAKRKKADLVVLSTRGLTGLKRALIGSVAEVIVRHAPCPVMVVR